MTPPSEEALSRAPQPSIAQADMSPDDVLDPTWPVAAARAADAKKATDVVILRVGDVLAITDYFIIASASNPRLVKTVVDEIEGQLNLAGGPRPRRTEGLDDLQWVLVDYGEFVVHVFLDDTRHYYDLERLWSDVARVEWRPEVTA